MITWRVLLPVTILLTPPESLLAGSPGGEVVGWGGDVLGQATGYQVVYYSTGAVRVAGQILTNAVEVSAGFSHSLALLSDRGVVGWGFNRFGQATGTGTSEPDIASGVVKLRGQLLIDLAAVSAGRNYSLALKRDGTVVAWGEEHTRFEMEPPRDLTNVTAISAGWRHNLALRADGTVAAWGMRSRLPPLSKIVAVAAAHGMYGNDLALRKDGTVVEWERDGDAVPPPSTQPTSWQFPRVPTTAWRCAATEPCSVGVLIRPARQPGSPTAPMAW